MALLRVSEPIRAVNLPGLQERDSPQNSTECRKYIRSLTKAILLHGLAYSEEYVLWFLGLARDGQPWDTWGVASKSSAGRFPTKRKKALRCPVDVFSYHDYRLFLADFYAAKKPEGFSYRAFSAAAGLGAPNYLQLVIVGKRNLSQEMAATFAATCGLSREGSRYFAALVAFNQANDAEERNAHYASLVSFGRYRRAHQLALAEAAYHSTWYLPAVRELVLSPHFRNDPAWIATALVPSISAEEAKYAIETLLELGLVHPDQDGRLRQRSSVVSTGALPGGLHLRNYHAEMMRRATAAMETFAPAQRDLTALTMCVSPAAFERIKARLADLRREVIDICETDVGSSQVLQLNLQLFPLSQDTAQTRVEKK